MRPVDDRLYRPEHIAIGGPERIHQPFDLAISKPQYFSIRFPFGLAIDIAIGLDFTIDLAFDLAFRLPIGVNIAINFTISKLSHPRWDLMRRTASLVLAGIVVVANVSIPVAVLPGLVHL